MERETWQNATKGRVAVVQHDAKGGLKQTLVKGGGTIALATEERVLNNDMAANDKLDVFKNGTMVPVRLIDGTEDLAEIQSNPNLKSEADLRDLFNLHWKQFDSEVSTIENVTTLYRMREIAQEGDATVRQVNIIEARLAEIDPKAQVVDVTLAGYGGGGQVASLGNNPRSDGLHKGNPRTGT